jgi:hypothetical protein
MKYSRNGDPDAIIFNFVASAVGPCRKILWHVKERYEYEGYILYTKSLISFAQILLICYLMALLVGFP